jgi:TP901 family phage tail tape measure protein
MGDVVGQAWWEADLKDEKLKAKLRELDALLRQQGQLTETSFNSSWSQAVDGAGRHLQRLGRNISSTGDAMTRNLTLPIVGAGVAVGKMALDFDTTLRQTVGLAGVAADAIGGIRAQILKMSGEVGKGPQELAEAFYFVASAGFEADEAMAVLEVSAKAAASGLGETQTIAQVLGGVINAYGKENMTAARAADILTEAVAQGTAEASGFAAVIGNVVPGAAALGVSFDQVTAAMAGMTLSGVGVEESATSLINIFSSLQKPTSAAEEALEGMGLSSAELRRQLREEGLLSTLRTLEERFAGNETASAAVFGNIRALRGVTALLGLDAEQLNDVFAEVEDSLGRQAEAYKATEGPQRDMARSMAEIQATAIELGEDVLPLAVDVLKQLAGGAKELAKWWRSLDADTKRMVVQLALVIAVAGPLLSIIGKLTTGVGGLLRVIAFLGGPRSVGAVRSLGLAFRALLGPIGVVVLALEGINLAGGALREWIGGTTAAFDRLERAAGKSFPEIKKAAHELADETGRSVDDIIMALDELTAGGRSWDEAVQMIIDGADRIPPAISDAARASVAAWKERDLAGTAIDSAAEIPPGMAAALEGGAPAVGDGADAIADEIAAAAVKAREAAIDQMAGLLNDLEALFDSDEDVADAWKGLIERMDDPYTEAERKADIFSKTTIANIRNAIKSGDPGLVADTKTLVDNMLTQIEAMEPGALASGEAVPPALRAGMDSQMAALITYLEEQTGVIVEELTLDEARELGLEGIWQYAQGMRANRIEAEQQAGRVAMAALAELHINGFSGGASLINSWVNGMSTQWWSKDIYRVEGMAGAAAQIFGHSLPTAGPLKGGVASGGISIGESWIGGMVASIVGGRASIEAAVGSVGAAMNFATAAGEPVMDFAGAAAGAGGIPGSSELAAAAALAGSAGNGGTTIITERHVHVHPVGPVPVETDDDLRRVIDRTEWIGDQGAWTDG